MAITTGDEKATRSEERVAGDAGPLLPGVAATASSAEQTSSSAGRVAAAVAATDAAWPDLLGVWSADGRSLTRLGVVENPRVGDRMMQDWSSALEAQRAAMDAMRDMVRQQQDLALASSHALFAALTQDQPGGSGTTPRAASALEQAAAGFGRAMRRQMEAMWTGCWAVFEVPSATTATDAEPQQSGRVGRGSGPR